MLQAGQTALVRVKAATADGKVQRDGYALAEFWEPGRDPEHDPSQRDRPDRIVELEWDEALRAWSGYVDTAGWAPGTWTVRGRAQCPTGRGPAKGWAWGALPLAA
jgi:hypothetical protein